MLRGSSGDCTVPLPIRAGIAIVAAMNDNRLPDMPEDNPLLQGLGSELPRFSLIRPGHVLPALDYLLADHRRRLDALTRIADPDWASLMAPLEEMDERLSRVWGPVAHLNAVCDSPELRPVYQQGVARVAEWQSELAQNEALYRAIRKVRERDDFPALDVEKQRVVEHVLRDFRLAGAELEGEDRQRFRDIQMRLSELATLFEQHVLDATRAFELHLDHADDTRGLPESVLAAAAQRAAEHDRYDGGWLFTLDAPSYIPFMQYADARHLRERMYRAYVTRASSGDLDNGPVMDEILALRREAALLLGFASYAEYSLATKMAGSLGEVTGFLRELARRSRPAAEAELAELRRFAEEELGLAELAAWDVPYVSEKLRRKKYAISQEELKPYFPESSVIDGMFRLVGRLYGIRIEPAVHDEAWHDGVRFFEIFDAGSDEKIAAFYLDPYARPHKRGGAWMDECTIRWRRPDDGLQLPVAYLVCNFDAPVGDRPALWTHDEVTTLFHEFGHGLHHMLTRVSELGVSGIRGVPWDAVELPSQFMENFCWERQVVDLFARHYQTGEPLPGSLFERMLAARNFQSGMQMLRQVEFALFDFELHADAGGQSVQQVLDRVRQEVAVLRPPSFNRFQHSFSHIFAGGYAAGYYSYKWAEVLSADAYAAFEEEGVLNADTAARFRREILAVGGSRDIGEAFVAFRGRPPRVDALLRHAGLDG